MPGEERQLRARLRQLEARHNAAEQCQLASGLLGSNHGAVGAGLQHAEQTLRLILSQETANESSLSQMQSSPGIHQPSWGGTKPIVLCN